jgi:Predicted membrane protein
MFDKCAELLVYLTAGVIILSAAAGILIRYFKKESLPDFFKVVFGIAIGYSVAAGALMLTLKFEEIKAEESFIPELFYPILALLVLSVVLAIGGALVSAYKKEFFKPYLIASSALVTIYILCLIFVAPLKAYMTSIAGGDLAGLAIGAVVLIGILIAAPLLFGKKNNEGDTRALAYAAVSIALSFALSYLRLFSLPQGGSITFASLLPLIVYSFMFGARRGAIAGFVYGILQAIQDPWIIHPLQFLLDYPIAFGMIGLAGIFKEIKLFENKPLVQFLLGGIAASILRYASHVISGTFAFGFYAEEAGYSAVAWGFLYNSFVFADIAIALVAGTTLFLSKSFKKLMFTN